MKKILVTGGFTGSVVVVYGEAGVGSEALPGLLSIDMSGAALKDEQKAYLKRACPVRYGEGFAQEWGTDKLRFTEDDYEVDFERDFFRPFGYAINKARCLKDWNKLSKTDRALCAAGVNGYVRHLGQNQWKNKMMPETFIKKRCWETDWDAV